MREAPRLLDFSSDPITTAKQLLGQRLVRMIDGTRLAGTIIEVEAYLGAKDRAAHTFGGRRTARNASMYLPGGHAYVYFVYGMHHCLNVVCGKRDEGVAVLLRAIEPTEGIERMRERRRGITNVHQLCSGPAKLTQALAIDRGLDGIDLRTDQRLWIEAIRARSWGRGAIIRGPRIGVDYAGSWAGKPLRFMLAGRSGVSAGRNQSGVEQHG